MFLKNFYQYKKSFFEFFGELSTGDQEYFSDYEHFSP
jgi:hypothetical protein